MVTRLVYNNKAFKIIDEYGFEFSSNEITFNDITIDFSGRNILDIPYKYQEIKIMQSDTEENILAGNVIFVGYLDDINLSDMKLKEEEREMTLTLLSPLKMATKRNVTLIGTNSIEIAIKRVLQPLIDDGFKIAEINIESGQITTNFVLETVENCMNSISFKRNIFWYIDEHKNIYVNSIDYLFGLPAKTIRYNGRETGLFEIQPKIENIDYANVINIKNIRLIYSANSSINNNYSEPYPIIAINKNIKKGDVIQFDNPIIIDENQLRINIGEDEEEKKYYCLNLQIKLSSGENKEYTIGISRTMSDDDYDKFNISNNITFSDENRDEKEVVLQKDSFFSNLCTGFKWNGENATIVGIKSDIALRYTTMRFMYSAEINKMKGIISESGQIEKTIDYNKKWTTLQQLTSHARSLIAQNSNEVNQIILKYDENPKLKIGDTIQVDEPEFYSQGKFAIKDVRYIYKSENDQEWEITAKSTDLISTYIDIFRPTEQEESEDSVKTVILSEFTEERIQEIHESELDTTQPTLNFGLEEQ